MDRHCCLPSAFRAAFSFEAPSIWLGHTPGAQKTDQRRWSLQSQTSPSVLSHSARQRINKKRLTYRFFTSCDNFENVGRQLGESCRLSLRPGLLRGIFCHKLVAHLRMWLGRHRVFDFIWLWVGTFSSILNLSFRRLLWVIVNLDVDRVLVWYAFYTAKVILITLHFFREPLRRVLIQKFTLFLLLQSLHLFLSKLLHFYCRLRIYYKFE